MARQPFNTRWAQGVEAEDNLNSFKAPGDVRLGTGWEGGQDKDAPPAGQQNYWQNRVDSALQDLERRGSMAYHSQAIYSAGAPCYTPEDGLFYESIANNNAGNTPATSPTYWLLRGASLYSGFSVGEYKDVAHNGTPDSGWLKCVGAVLLRSAYPKLFDKIGTTYNVGGELSTQFRLPDWRGVFPRFLDDGRGIDTPRTLGNIPQESQNLQHGHSGSTSSAGAHVHALEGEDVGGPGRIDLTGRATVADAEGKGTITPYGNTASGGAHTHVISISSSGGTEARPVNLTQVRWIRYL